MGVFRERHVEFFKSFGVLKRIRRASIKIE